jgi:predicted DNA-binding protein with PD1-like motif
MKSRLVWEQAGERTFVVVLDAGDEAFAAISDFANSNRLGGASLSAIGAFERATVGWFDLRAKSYRPIEIDEQCEGLTLLGDIAVGDDGRASLHMHAVLGLKDGSTRGGHFLNGIVRPTLEVTIVETPAHLRRRKQAGLGIALIQP